MSRGATGVSFCLSFHLALLDPTRAYWLDDPPDVTCKDSTLQVALDGCPLSCKQQVPGSSPGASSRTRSSEPYGACLACPGGHSAAIAAVSGLTSFARSAIDPPPRLRWGEQRTLGV
jgi:hypothetical protein